MRISFFFSFYKLQHRAYKPAYFIKLTATRCFNRAFLLSNPTHSMFPNNVRQETYARKPFHKFLEFL